MSSEESEASALLARGDRSVGEWLADLRSLADKEPELERFV
jgi:hypothetical protein